MIACRHLAARRAKAAHKLTRILVVDWDVHHGNGTQDIFYEVPEVYFYSIHRYGNGFYPGTGSDKETGKGKGEGYTLNVPVRFGTARKDYHALFTKALDKAAAKIKPELVLVSAGFDAHSKDPVGSLGLEVEDFKTLTRQVLEVAKTHAKASPNRYVMPNQYENSKNVEAHFETTGPEIWRQTDGRVTHVFASLGTCGTIMGVSKFLRTKKPGIKVIAVQPSEGHDVPGLRNLSQLDVSKLFDRALVDDILEIDYELAYRRALELCRAEGLLAGPSSGLILEGALQIIARDRVGCGVMVFPDNIFKYVSSMVKHLPELASGTEA